MPQSGIVTLLFTSLVEPTNHPALASDEQSDAVFRAHHKLLTEAIEAAGGDELEWLGDGVLAAFQSTADAVRCAIVMQQAANRPLNGIKLEMRIGVHVGEVLRRDEGYFGTPIVIARRLCDRADGGQILCGRMIADLLSSRKAFGFHDLGDQQLKGITTPVGVCEVLYERNDPLAMLTRTPFVGRAAQLKRLIARFDEMTRGNGAVAMLRGEAGIGKSRTLEEFADHATQTGALVLHGACYDGDWQPPYGPFAEAIAEYSRIAPAAEVNAVLGRCAGVLARIAPSLREMFSDLSEPVTLDKEEERLRLFDAVAQFLIAVAKVKPLVLILDDLHWADRASVGLLAHVAHFAEANSILLVGAYRDAEVNRTHPLSVVMAGIGRMRNFESITLKGLDTEELASLLEMIGDNDAPPDLVKTLGHATEGNPLFVRELLLHLFEEGKILQEGQGWSSRLSIDQLGIPDGVRQLIDRRLLRLSSEANRLLSFASAFHGSFSFEVAMAAAELDEQTALGAIDEALGAQLLRPGPAGDTFDFTHALIRHTLYSGMNPARRTRLHRKIAEQMEHVWGERAAHHAAEVAYQFWRGAAASGTARGADYAIAAADNAEAAYAHDDVAAFLQIALELLPPDDRRRPRLLGRRALAIAWTLNHDEALSTARDATEKIAAIEGTSAAADYCDQAARTFLFAGVTRGAWELAAEGLALIGDRRDITWASLTEIDLTRKEAEDLNNPGIRTDSAESRELYGVLRRLPRAQLETRNFDPPFESRDEIERDPAPPPTPLLMLAGDYRRCLPLQQAEAVENEQHGALARAARGWADVARCHTALGNFAEARASLDRALKLSARLPTPTFAVLSLVAAQGEMHYATDEGWEQLMANSAAASFMNGANAESKWASAMINAYVSYLLARINQPALAIQRVNLLPAALEAGAPWARTYCSMACIAAATLWMLNRTDHVDVIERNIRSKVLAQDFRSPMSDSRLSLARLSALSGRQDEAREWFAQARRVLDEQGARPLRAITDYDEGLMYQRRDLPGDRQKALALMEEAVHQFQQLGMTGWLNHVEQPSNKVNEAASQLSTT